MHQNTEWLTLDSVSTVDHDPLCFTDFHNEFYFFPCFIKSLEEKLETLCKQKN